MKLTCIMFLLLSLSTLATEQKVVKIEHEVKSITYKVTATSLGIYSDEVILNKSGTMTFIRPSVYRAGTSPEDADFITQTEETAMGFCALLNKTLISFVSNDEISRMIGVTKLLKNGDYVDSIGPEFYIKSIICK